MQVEVEVQDTSGARRREVMERLFTDLQVARFNQLYYQARAKTVKTGITVANVIAALSASVALTSLLRNWAAAWVLSGLMVIAAISAAIGPVLGLEEKYSQLARAALGHTIIKDRIWCLLRDLKLSDIDDSHEAREREIGAFRDALSVLDEDPHERVRDSCWRQAEKEFPADKAWTIV